MHTNARRKQLGNLFAALCLSSASGANAICAESIFAGVLKKCWAGSIAIKIGDPSATDAAPREFVETCNRRLWISAAREDFDCLPNL